MYIYRELLDKITNKFRKNTPQGLILTGIVGCGKTTLISRALQQLSTQFRIFSFSGDDSVFRQKIIEDSNYLYNEVLLHGPSHALIFVDEVQKVNEVFDALKIAFDKGQISFIVSGSNPAYLTTIAKKRLQRRAEQIFMLPISLNEYLASQSLVPEDAISHFENILWHNKSLNELSLPLLTLTPEMNSFFRSYFIYGGLPLSLLATTPAQKLKEIQLTVERGFDLMSQENSAVGELVKLELAQLNAQEFTFKNILAKTRIRQRTVINKFIDDLINHGYLVKKQPLLFIKERSSYLSVFSFIDPGIVSYITAEYDYEFSKGFRIEAYVHARLSYLTINSPFKSTINYFKPHGLDINKNIRFQPGEIDFIFSHGRRIVPIEVKATDTIKNIDTRLISSFSKEHQAPFSIVLYGGVPHIDKNKNILFWPWWLI
jgi:predicted AAA+ superfamily ATPase